MSVDFEVDFEGLDRLLRDLRGVSGGAKGVIRKAMHRSLTLIATAAKEGPDMPVDLGRLRASIGDESKEGIHKVKGLGIETVGWVGSRVVYALPMEIGRQPGKMPPVGPIEEWAARHGMAGAGFVIARSIAKRGTKAWRETKGKHYLEKAAKKKAGEVVKVFESAIDRLLRGHRL